MATSMSSPCCRLCHGILHKKQRRTIFGESFGVYDQLLEIIDQIPHPNDEKGNYICGMCWNKLNRLGKIEYDIKTKLEKLKSERHDLIRDLRLKHKGNISVQQVCTPKSKKHVIVHSPTPRKVKQLFTESKSTQLTDIPTSSSNPVTDDKDRKKVNIQLFSPSKIKVVYRGPKEKLKSKVIPAGDSQNIIRCISRGESHQKTSKVIYNSTLQDNIHDCVIKDLRKELNKLSSTKTMSCLRKTSSDKLATINFESWNLELQLHSPLLCKIISGFFNPHNHVAVAVIAAVIQKNRVMHMSAFHHAVTQVLDNGGATDECINLLNKLGLCLSPSAVAKKKSDLIARQTDHIQRLMMSEKKALEENTDSLPAVLQGFIYQ